MSTGVSIPSYSELLWPTLKAVREVGDLGTIEEIVDKVIELEGALARTSSARFQALLLVA